ncbi:MAG: TonB-dependent receptor, partial [Holophagales bacterium]|nr:TonB-dependent receptor [Holophagales bacterium]
MLPRPGIENSTWDVRAPLLLLLALFLAGLAGSGSARPGSEEGASARGSCGHGERPWRGMPLGQALRDLRGLGLELFFTSNLVGSHQRVSVEPTSQEPLEVLREILRPHGLAAIPGPGGRWVVVRGEPELSALRGKVVEAASGTPIPGARMWLAATGRETWSGADGTFELLEVPAGDHVLEAHLPGFVIHRQSLEVEAGSTADVRINLEAAPLEVDRIVVTPSRVSLLRDEPVVGLSLDRGDIFALPHLSDDIFRALTLLPGVTGEEVSARFHVRGGRTDEVLVLLDDVELYEPYHMKDYSSSLSIIAPRSLREVSLITGGFPARYGDRMSGVLDMRTVVPERDRFHLGLGLLIAEAGGSGAFDGDRGHWYASARRGSPELALDFLGSREEPRYWDAFGKASLAMGETQQVGLHFLHSDDSLDYFNIDPDTTEDYRTSYGSSYAWLTHQNILGPSMFVDSALYVGRVQRDRRGDEIEMELEDGEGPDSEGGDGEDGEEEDGEDGGEGRGGDGPGAVPGFTILDRRDFDVFGLKQGWSWQKSDRHLLTWGFEARSLEARYDYFNGRELEDPLADIRSEPRTGTTRFLESLRGEQYGVYFSDRSGIGDQLTLELGLRYDRQTLTDDNDLSPRLNLVYALGESSTARLAWGYFYQSQRPYELQVEDGVTTLASAERRSEEH